MKQNKQKKCNHSIVKSYIDVSIYIEFDATQW